MGVVMADGRTIDCDILFCGMSLMKEKKGGSAELIDFACGGHGLRCREQSVRGLRIG